MKDPEWKPDFGPAAFVERWGATVTGARKYLIAFNVNLISTKEQAHRIALMVREQGRKDRVRLFSFPVNKNRFSLQMVIKMVFMFVNPKSI